MGFYTNFLSIASEVTQRSSVSNERAAGAIAERIIGNTGIHQEIGDYHVTTLYPSRGDIGNVLASRPDVKRSLARAASVLSGVPTHGIQGASYGAESNAFHIVTKRDSTSRNSAAIHTANVATLHRLMFYPADQLAGNNTSDARANLITKHPLAKGTLEDSSKFNAVMVPLTSAAPFSDRADKGLMYATSYSGMMGMYGKQQGYDYWFVRNDRLDQYSENSVRNRLKPGVEALKAAFGISSTDHTIRENAMRTRRDAVSRYTQIFDSMADDSPSAPRMGDVNSFGFAHNQLENYVHNLSENTSLSQAVTNSYDYATFSRASTATTRLAPRSTQTAAPTTPTTPAFDPLGVLTNTAPQPTTLPDPPAEINIDTTVADTPEPSTTRTEPTPNPRTNTTTTTRGSVIGAVLDGMGTVPETTRTPEVIAQPMSVDALLNTMSSGSYGTFTDIYTGMDYDASTNIAHNYVNRDIISVISDSAFKRLEERFPTGASEVDPPEAGNLSANERSIAALQKIRERLNAPDGTDRDAKFYLKLGNNMLPANSFDIRNYKLDEMTPFIKKRLSLTGALVGINEDGSQKWLLDDVGRTAQNLDVNPSDTHPSRMNAQRSIDISNAPSPHIDFDHTRMRLINSSMPIGEALNNGYVIPIKGNEAIFVPSFTALDFTYGLELEAVNVNASGGEVNRQMESHFGYNMDKMGFKGTLQQTGDPSMPHSYPDPSTRQGSEYVTPIMTGVRAIKSAYLLGETLKIMGGRTGGYYRVPGVSRNDPTSVHVNVGTIANVDRPSTLKFAADYLRLVEDVYKKMTTPDARYRYSPIGDMSRVSGSQWVISDAVQPNSLTPAARANAESARQFWSQSISNVRQAGSSGMTEYEYLRTHGDFYHDISRMQSAYDPESRLSANSNTDRLAKYKTMAISKLLLHGVMEVRSGMYVPGGDEAVAQLVMASKLASDVYQGASNGDTGSVALTDKLVPPTDGWGSTPRDVEKFNDILKTVFGISGAVDQKFVKEYYDKCKAGRH